MYNEKMIEQGRGRGVLCVCVCVFVCVQHVCVGILSIIFTWEKNSAAAEKCEYHR